MSYDDQLTPLQRREAGWQAAWAALRAAHASKITALMRSYLASWQRATDRVAVVAQDLGRQDWASYFFYGHDNLFQNLVDVSPRLPTDVLNQVLGQIDDQIIRANNYARDLATGAVQLPARSPFPGHPGQGALGPVPGMGLIAGVGGLQGDKSGNVGGHHSGA